MADPQTDIVQISVRNLDFHCGINYQTRKMSEHYITGRYRSEVMAPSYMELSYWLQCLMVDF